MRLTCSRLLRSLPVFFLTVFLCRFSGYAQENKIFRGVVSDAKGQPIEGASVTIKGTTQGVTSDREGKFTIEAKENSAALISSVGYAAKEVQLKGNSTIHVTLILTSGSLDEVVVVGYGSVRKRSYRLRSCCGC